MQAKIYHNPRCSKSRATLELLQQRDVDIEIVEYLKQPPSADDIRQILSQLGLAARDIIRSKETAFVDSGLSLDASEPELIALMVQQPSIIERPIVVAAGQARIGRPPENVLELLD